MHKEKPPVATQPAPEHRAMPKGDGGLGTGMLIGIIFMVVTAVCLFVLAPIAVIFWVYFQMPSVDPSPLADRQNYSATPGLSDDAREILEASENVLEATNDYDRSRAAWPIVMHHKEREGTSRPDSGQAISLALVIAENPHRWSVGTASRPTNSDNVAGYTARSLIFFVQKIPWFPIKEASLKMIRGVDHLSEGETELLEWKWEDLSDDTTERITLSFRLK